ncbi:MAG: SDR family NAD(P)-dependent oxidoreductase [Burkholderiales bacterium]|jgi:short-subunit dehydrogenase|nr:SDR family NAD(P)-dependent oxidoreductase [Burkholderiales bacterium]
MDLTPRPLAVVTGASSGIGHELARLCAADGYDLVVAADEGPLDEVANELRARGATVTVVHTDLATAAGVARLVDTIGGRRVDVLMANAGHGLGRAFLKQDFQAIRHVINTNITGTLELIHQVGRSMQDHCEGHILVTGSIAGLMPGAFEAVYNATKAFVDSFCYALRNELKDSGVTVTCLMPGVTDTHFFERAGMTDTRIGTSRKADPADVARAGYEAMLDGDSDVVAGWRNKLQVILANMTPPEVLAEQHRKLAKPGSARR